MKTIHHISCGLDVHKNTVVACIQKLDNSLKPTRKNEDGVSMEIRKFDTFSSGLQELREWIESNDCYHVAMESTGVYWHPVYSALEDLYNGEIKLFVVNARHLKNVEGKKSDVMDAEWICDLMRCGLVKASFIPPKNIRELRELTRYRKFIVQDIGRQKNRIEKTLQTAGFKLSSFMSDIFGVSGRALIGVLAQNGYITANDVEDFAKYIAAGKRDEIKRVLTNRLSTHHQFVLDMQVKHLDELLSHLSSVEASIADLSSQFDKEIELLDTIPGISVTAATTLIAEIGTDMSKFPTAEHLASWAGLVPGCHESAGKKKTPESRMETTSSKVCSLNVLGVQ
jgi:transposase